MESNQFERKPLFVTQSGIAVHQVEQPKVEYNLLTKIHRTGLCKLNGETISGKAYRRLVKAIAIHHPDSCVEANTYNIVFVYPKLTPGW